MADEIPTLRDVLDLTAADYRHSPTATLEGALEQAARVTLALVEAQFQATDYIVEGEPLRSLASFRAIFSELRASLNADPPRVGEGRQQDLRPIVSAAMAALESDATLDDRRTASPPLQRFTTEEMEDVAEWAILGRDPSMRKIRRMLFYAAFLQREQEKGSTR